MGLWDIFKKKPAEKKADEKPAAEPCSCCGDHGHDHGPAAAAAAPEKAAPATAAPAAKKSPAEMTDDELAADLDRMSPEILAQAKTPEMRKLILNIYRQMLKEGVDVEDEKEVKKWLKKHPEVLQGGEVQKIETVRNEGPRTGRNDPCPCGSGKKYKKCCGSGK